MLLYKYAPPERTDVLRNGQIRLTQPSSFNDPFETLPYLQSLVTPGRGEEIAEQFIEAIFDPVRNEEIEFLDLLRMITESINEGGSVADEGGIVTQDDKKTLERIARAMEWMVETRNIDETEIVNTLLKEGDFASEFGNLLDLEVSEEEQRGQDVFAEMRERTRRLQSLLQDGFQAIYSDRYGILSLSQRQKSLLMWSHYAQAHSGFLLAFDSKHEFFQSACTSEESDSYFGTVEYSSKRPNLPLKLEQMITSEIDEQVQRMVEEGTLSFDQEAESTDGLKKKLEERARDVLFTKSDHWDYEEEWRLVQPLSAHDERIEEGEDKVYLFEWPPGALKAIVTGCKMEDDILEELKALLQKDRYSHVDLYGARTSREEFGLEYEPVDV